MCAPVPSTFSNTESVSKANFSHIEWVPPYKCAGVDAESTWTLPWLQCPWSSVARARRGPRLSRTRSEAYPVS
eukprot:679097-Pelagomonas_calceolata.AAC.1